MAESMRRTVGLGRGQLPTLPCRAHSKRSGKPCRNKAILGATVCVNHGGSAPQVKRKAAERVREALDSLIDPERILREIAALAYFDPRMLFDDDGGCLPPSKWSDEVAAAVGAFEILKGNVNSGDGKLDNVIKPRVWDKPKALEMLAKHRGLLIERVEISATVNLESRLHAGRKRVADARGK